MSARYFIKRAGVESGPYSHEELLSLLDSGSLSPGDVACFARKWRWLGGDQCFPLEWLHHPPGLKDIRIPRSTAVVWACSAVVLLVLLVCALSR